MASLAKCVPLCFECCSECCSACCKGGCICCETCWGHLGKAFGGEGKNEDISKESTRSYESSELISSVDPMLIPPSICIAEEVTPFKF
jgi:hypothetical protein